MVENHPDASNLQFSAQKGLLMSTNIFRRFVSGVTLITFAFAVTGCSAFKSSTQVFTVTADPSDAEIYINGNRAGTGTASQSVKRNRDVQVMVKKAGYSTVKVASAIGAAITPDLRNILRAILASPSSEISTCQYPESISILLIKNIAYLVIVFRRCGFRHYYKLADDFQSDLDRSIRTYQR